jgi:hypothetical protein
MQGETGDKCLSTGSYHCKTRTANHISIKEGEIFPSAILLRWGPLVTIRPG